MSIQNNQTCKICGTNENLIPIREFEKIKFYKDIKQLAQDYICNKCIVKDTSDYGFCDVCEDDYAYLITELDYVGYDDGIMCPTHKKEYDSKHNVEVDYPDLIDIMEYKSKE